MQTRPYGNRTLYLPAIALSAATGLNVYFCIISMGVLCTVYTVLGGIEAVIWTDVLQVIVFYTGAFVILVIAIFSLDGGIPQFIEICSTKNNFNWVNKGWDCTHIIIIYYYCGEFFLDNYP